MHVGFIATVWFGLFCRKKKKKLLRTIFELAEVHLILCESHEKLSKMMIFEGHYTWILINLGKHSCSNWNFTLAAYFKIDKKITYFDSVRIKKCNYLCKKYNTQVQKCTFC